MSLDIRKGEALKPLTTFKIGGPARYFADIESLEELREASAFARKERLAIFVLGGGSNVLISDRGFDGLVLHPVNKGVEVAREDAETVRVRVNAAESWDQVVATAVDHGWWGIENLSHIPGQAGAALVQNIGAYGQQLSDTLERAEVVDLEGRAPAVLSREACRLGYRKSLFNTSGKRKFLITSITLKLSKHPRPNLRYADVAAYFDRRGIRTPTQKQLRRAIIEIRDLKFPFPREERGGNAGSFFKNQSLTGAEYKQLELAILRQSDRAGLERLRDFKNRIPSRDGRIKIPTAFLIDVSRLKGLCIGGARVNETQPLVIVNQGGATGQDVMSLARAIRQAVFAKTGVEIPLEPEPVGFTPSELSAYLALV